MDNIYTKLATRIIGELEVRYNWASAKNNPREVVINLWSQELTKITASALTPEVIKKAMEEWDADNKTKPPLVGQFIVILKRLTHDHQHRQIKQLESQQTQHVDWIGMFNRCDNKGKFQFFMRNRKAAPSARDYARDWFNKNTRFSNDNIYQIINGKIPN